MHNVNLPNCGYSRKLASARSIQFLDRPKHQEDLVGVSENAVPQDPAGSRFPHEHHSSI